MRRKARKTAANHAALIVMKSQLEHPDRLVRMPEIVRLSGLSRPTVYRLIESGEFPQPRQLTQRCVAWPYNEIEKWLQQRKRKREACA